MPLEIVRNDITKMPVDAIVNAANESLLGGGGVDGAIHRAAGPKLLKECRALNGCKTGEAKITKGYNLPAKHVIHTVGPIWHGGDYGEEALLISAYQSSLKLAAENGCESVAFPLISAGVYGYPKADALKIAEKTIIDFLKDNDMQVYIVVFDKNSFKISEEIYKNIESFIDDNYAIENSDTAEYSRRRGLRGLFGGGMKSSEAICFNEIPKEILKNSDESLAEEELSEELEDAIPPCYAEASKMAMPAPKSLDDALNMIDESWSQMLLRKIDEQGLKDSECYKKANVDRKLFSKIRGDINYKPKKTTAIAFAIALELSLSETKEMLMKAGYALSHSNKFDIIIEYFIQNKNYNIFEINEALFAFDQVILG